MANIPSVPGKPTVLIILDGVGMNPSRTDNAFALANTPRLDEYFAKHPHSVIEASGRASGLPEGQMGNSEVGHLTIGCGHIVRQDLVRIDDAVKDESFCQRAALVNAMENAKKLNRPIHLLGLVSDGGVHSHTNHLIALINMAEKHGVKPLVHMFADGRDTNPKSAKKFIALLGDPLAKANGHIATICGRYYAMDRDNRWDRTQLAWDAIVKGIGTKVASAMEAVDAAYANNINDEFMMPYITPHAMNTEAGDQAIFFNFRNDRPRQLTEALAQPDFEGFDRDGAATITVTCLTEYAPEFLTPIAFPPERPEVTLGQTIALAGIQQFHTAETEKYAHVTFFFNGGKERPYAGEDREMIPSPQVATYDEQPEMNADQVADSVIRAMEADKYGFILVNFANCDMVGHTAQREAIIQAVESVDREAGRVLDAAMANGYAVVLTSDHGNCDEMIDPITGDPNTQHTVYPVPCLVMDPETRWRLTTGGELARVAPTVLELMGIQKPDMMYDSLILGEYK